MSKARQSREYAAFDRMVDQLLTVPKSALKERIEAHKAKAALNPNKRGPKPKIKPSDSSAASRDAS